MGKDEDAGHPSAGCSAFSSPGDAPALADAIARTMDDPAAARRMGVHGRDDVRADFSWDVIVGRLAEVYARVRKR